MSRQAAALVQLQLLTGARPGELLALRGCDIDTTAQPWVYVPASHKNSHRGHKRVIFFGPKAQRIVGEFLKPDLNGYLFSPADAERESRERRHAARVTPLAYGNSPGTNRRRNPKRRPGERYTVTAYRRAIARACDRAFPPPERLAARDGESERTWLARLSPEQKGELAAWRRKHRWHPHQLRHNAATELRKRFGIEAAQVILGHCSLDVTQVYAAKDVEAARRIMADVG